MTNKDLLQKVFDISDKFNKTTIETRTIFAEAMKKVEEAILVNNEILKQLNDNNKLHQKIVEVNTKATEDLSKNIEKHSEVIENQSNIIRNQYKMFWFIFLLFTIVFISIVVKEKFSDIFNLFFK